MSDIDRLREALEDADYRLATQSARRMLYELAAALRDYLALLESDAIVIKRDAEGNWPAEKIAQLFHEQYERLAPAFGYSTRAETRTPWPPSNADLMIATVAAVLARLALAHSSKAPE